MLLLLGAAARITAIVGLSLLGISQIFTPLMPVQVTLAVLYTAVLYLGSGAMSLWTPETARFTGGRAKGAVQLKTRPCCGGRSDMRRLRRLWKPRLLVWAALLPLMWLALRDIPLQECVEHHFRLHLWQLLCLAVLNIGIFLLLTSRWWLILRFQGHRLPLLSMAGYRIAAFAITYFTPAPRWGVSRCKFA